MPHAKARPDGKPFLGEILLERRLITSEQLHHALRLQVGGLRRLGHVLVMMKAITDADLMGALSEQLRIPIVRVEEEFRSEARAVLPRHLCRRYGVLPLALEPDNVLRLAMMDPLDDVAIRDVEGYTGMAVSPVLASLEDIQAAAGRLVAFSRQDLFNPQVYRTAAKVAATAALALLVVAGALFYRQVRAERYGTVSRADGSTIFKNRDLMVDLGRDGSVYFTGRGAHADGYFGVRFVSVQDFAGFVRSRTSQLSESQHEWLDWLLAERLGAPEVALNRGAPGP